MQLDYENLKKYVNTVLQLEKEKMVLENSRVQMEEKRDSLGKNMIKPKAPEREILQIKSEDDIAGNVATACFLLAILTILILLLQFFLRGGSLEGVNVWIYIIIAGAFEVISVISDKKAKKNYDSMYMKLEEEYQANLRRYNKLIAKEQKKMEEELALVPQINQDIDIIEAEHQRVENLLTDYYSLGIIYPVYHGDFVAIAMFSQYLNMGMCYTLTGHEGCYTLYEQQKLQGIIITKLNVIISQLDEISGQLRSLQYSLLQAISETNEKIDKLTVYAKEHGNLQQQHNAVMEYKADCMESEMKFHNQYVMLRDLINK